MNEDYAHALVNILAHIHKDMQEQNEILKEIKNRIGR